MKDTDKKQGISQEARALALVANVAAVVREGLHELVVRSGLGVVGAMLEADGEALCGPRYEDREHGAHRAGHVRGELAMGGRRVEVKRPRVRSIEGRELPLPTWEHFAGLDPLSERAYEQMLVGVATRGVLALAGAARSGREDARHEQERGEPPLRCGDGRARRRAARAPARRLEARGADDGRHPLRRARDPRRARHRSERQEARARAARGRDRERGIVHGALVESRRAGTRHDPLTARRDRRRQGAAEGSARGLRQARAGAALPAAQEAQRARSAAGADAPERERGTEPGVRESRQADGAAASAQPRASLGEGAPRRGGVAARGPRGDAHRGRPRTAARAGADAGDDEPDRELELGRPPRVRAREALARRRDDRALDGRRGERGGEGLPAAEGLRWNATLARLAQAQRRGDRWRGEAECRSCVIGCFTSTSRCSISTTNGAIPAERPWLRSATDVAVVESADLRHCHDIAALGWLDRAWLGRVLPESELRARGVIGAGAIAKATTEGSVVPDDH